MTDILEKICSAKREHVSRRKALLPFLELRRQTEQASIPRLGFAASLLEKKAKGAFGLIAEIKKASPSRGLIREDFSPAELAEAYRTGGAACLSVLTDEPFFSGQDSDIVKAKLAASLPILRKDFMLDPYQIYESRYLGADCVLLILSALSDHQAHELEDIALALGMDVLIETHNQAELDRALDMKAPLIGVNNRDLKSLTIDLSPSRALLPQIPGDRVGVAESGLYHYDDLTALAQIGVTTFLVGESLMRQKDVALATRKLLTGSDHA